jgi:hypothetical protein
MVTNGLCRDTALKYTGSASLFIHKFFRTSQKPYLGVIAYQGSYYLKYSGNRD